MVHDELTDLRIVSSFANIDKSKHIKPIGLKIQSRLDFLSKYCGYSVFYENNDDDTQNENVTNFKSKARDNNLHEMSNKNKRK